LPGCAIRSGRTTDFWKLIEKTRLLPRETRDYVPMILAAIIIAKNPAQYGFAIDPDPRFAYETVTLTRPMDLRRVAEWAGTTIDDVQALNPELRRWTTPVRDESYTLKVPVGTAEAVNQRLVELAVNDLASLNWYTVKKGETVTSIAKKLKVGRTDLAEANYLKTTSKLTAGHQLLVPREPTVLMAAQTDRPIPAPEPRTATGDAVVRAVADASSEPERGTKIIYQVKKGDTLSSIARVFRTTVSSLKTWNSIPGSHIRAGERLTIYSSSAR
jgi:membrane-bound lytic murein transglycosylase D